MTAALPVIFCVGPSAVGKSAVALELARICGAEIVSCDAMQVYREPAIVSDKPSAAIRAQIPHHLIDVVSVEEEFNAARYITLARAAIDGIRGRGKPVIVAGGSGMYMMALLDGLFEAGEPDPALRVALEARPLEDLYAELERTDPAAAARITARDRKRIMRALEVFHATGIPISEQQKKRQGIWGQYPIRIFGLERPRAEMYRRAEARIEAMFSAGLMDEVRGLLSKKLSATAAGLIGLPEIRGVIDGAWDLERAKYLMKLNTRHYIKRQMTWFRRDKRIEWLMLDGSDNKVAADRILKLLSAQ